MQKFDLILKRISSIMSTHMVVNKGFLPTATACPRYPQRLVAVGKWRMLACISVLISIITFTSWGQAANHKVSLLKGWGNYMKLFTNIDTTSHAHRYYSPQSALLNVFIMASEHHNITRRQWFPDTKTLNIGGGVVSEWWFQAEYVYS